MRRAQAFAGVLSAWFLAVLLGACGTPAPTSDGPTLSSTDSPVTESTVRPGAIDPARNFTEWPDDELFLTTPPLAGAGDQSARIYEPAADLSSLTTVAPTPAPAAPHDAVDAEAGRFLAADRETIAQAYRNGTNLDVSIFGQSSVSWSLPNLAPRLGGATDFFDLAAGDLDGWPVQDADGNYERRDELVVAHASPSTATDDKLTVTVLDFREAVEGMPVAKPKSIDTFANVTSLKASGGPNNVVAVTTGDFDGDADARIAERGLLDEIAVAYLETPEVLRIDVLRYSVTLTTTMPPSLVVTLERLATQAFPAGTGTAFDAISAVAADFDGDGLDELAIGTARHATGNVGLADVRVFQIAGSPMTISQAQEIRVKEGTVTTGYPWRVLVAAGNFTFAADPNLGWVASRHQLAVACRGAGLVTVRMIDLGYDLAPVMSAAYEVSRNPGAAVGLVAGGFRGVNLKPPTEGEPSADPTWSFALWTWDATGSTVTMLRPSSTAPGAAKAPQKATAVGVQVASAPTEASRLPLVAADVDGNTVFLGAPVHITLNNLLSTDFILGEPPKHAYWDKWAAVPKVNNLTRYDNFNLSLFLTSTSKFASSGKDTVSYGVGGSASASATATVGVGANIGIVAAKASVSTEVSAKVGYDYNNNEATLNSGYQSREVTTEEYTLRDDVVMARIQTLDIWRYRVYGLGADAGAYPFYDFVLPGPFETVATRGGGKNFGWYQPVHENGNILSYPKYDTAFSSPEDLGSVKRNGLDATGIMSQGTWFFADDTGGTEELKFSSEENQSVEFGYSHALTANASIKTTASAEAKAFGVSASTSASLSFEAHGSYSWGHSGTSSTTTTSTTGLKLTTASGSPAVSYGFHPLVYVTADGTIRAAYAVDPWASQGGRGFWKDRFAAPDVALNLPWRFVVEPSDSSNASPTNPNIFWVPNVLDSRKLLRGFFVREGEQHPVTGEHELIPPEVVPDPGSTNIVLLQARVYNYSAGEFGMVPAGTDTCFYKTAMKLDDVTRKFYEDPAERMVLIGCATLPQIAPQTYVVAEVPWDTAGASGTGEKRYRIYVRVDANNEVTNETYDNDPQTGNESTSWCDPNDATNCFDPGQNNEGFGEVKVVAAVAGGPLGRKTAHVGIENPMAGFDRRGDLGTGTIQVYRNVPFEFRVILTSDVRTWNTSYVIVYDGDPERGGVAIAGKQVHTGNDDPEGAPVWFEWAPDRLGSHKLYARVLQTLDDPAPGGNVGTLNVVVIPAPGGPKR